MSPNKHVELSVSRVPVSCSALLRELLESLRSQAHQLQKLDEAGLAQFFQDTHTLQTACQRLGDAVDLDEAVLSSLREQVDAVIHQVEVVRDATSQELDRSIQHTSALTAYT